MMPDRLSGRIKYCSMCCMVIILIIAVAFISGCDNLVFMEPTAGQACRWDFISSVDGTALPCSIYLPKSYNPDVTYPLWVDLHALYSRPVLDNEPANVFSNDLKGQADEKGFIVVCPWGRNLHGLYIDGKKNMSEPDMYDDFMTGADSWQPLNGAWSASGGVYSQTDTGYSWKESVLNGSTGTDYSVRVRIKDITTGARDAAVGVNLRRSSDGDLYHLDLYKDGNGTKFVRAYKLEGGTWQNLYNGNLEWKPQSESDGWIDLKVSCYKGYLEMYINKEIVNLQPGYDSTAYGYGQLERGTPLPSGPVSLCTYGGSYQFDDVRIQNEYEYGGSDVVDCVLAAQEKYKIDPTRVYLSGHSQGGLGAYTTTLHHPDMFAATRPADGFSDLYDEYLWLKQYYPRNPGGMWSEINDSQFPDYEEAIAGGEISESYPERLSILNGNSARYILENAVNSNFRIVHGSTDSGVPNSYEPLEICWYARWLIFWFQLGAPDPYTWGTSDYRNGQDIADLLASWASPGRYSVEYITDPSGHGFQDPYYELLDYFKTKQANRRPLEVAYKTYDNKNNGAWWLRLRIPEPDSNKPGMARVLADPQNNSAAIHARNLSDLSLDITRMGLDNGEGKTMSFTIDDNTEPNVFPITDYTGAFDLELQGPWTAASGYTVVLDGVNISFSLSGTLLTVDDVPAAGQHTLMVQSPGSLPVNLVTNNDAESGTGGTPEGWTTSTTPGASATFSWDGSEAHRGDYSLRIKSVNITDEGSVALWASNIIPVTPSTGYQLSSYLKARMFRGQYLGIGIEWYNPEGGLIDTTWSDNFRGATNASSFDWTPVIVSGTAPEGSAAARVVAGSTDTSAAGQVTGSAWFDDFSFTQVTSATF